MEGLDASAPILDAIPDLVHGFGRRAGPAGFETREATAARTADRLAPHGRLLLLQQVHGATVQHAPWTGRPPADAAVAGEPGLLLGIETADCLPVLIVDPQRRAVAAAHAGWRGTVAGVTREAVAALVREGSRASDLLAALGPGIGPCCYEIGDDVREAFGPAGAAFFRKVPERPRSPGRARREPPAARRMQASTRATSAAWTSARSAGRTSITPTGVTVRAAAG